MDRPVTNFRIDVDVKRALEVLSRSVFAGADQSIRELITNAADSLAQLPPEQESNLEIRLIPSVSQDSDSPGTLRISDTGVGMTYGEAKQRLGKLFSTDKQSGQGLVGQFGIGFYSCFPLCYEVEVFTRTRARGDSGTRLRYRGGEEMQIQPWPVDQPGSTVLLHLRPEHRRLLQQATLTNIVRRYCNYIRYPI